MTQNVLKVENLTKTYGGGHSAVHAVNNVSFAVDGSEIILIMGPSGSGKTTLLTMIGGLLSIDSGKIFHDGVEITSLKRKGLAKLRASKVGFIFQSYNLLTALNVWENVVVVLELIGVNSKEARKKAADILSRLGLADRLEHKISDLSGGEKQRVSIARALAVDPKLILADEPTANLDSKSGHKVTELLKDIAKKDKRAVVIVSHDMRLIDVADRVLWLEDGKIKEGHEELVTDPICEAQLQISIAPYSLKHEGQTYYFCSKKCLFDFKKSL